MSERERWTGREKVILYYCSADGKRDNGRPRCLYLSRSLLPVGPRSLHPLVRTFRFGTEHTLYARNNRVLILFKLTVRRDNTRFVTPYKTHCSIRNKRERPIDLLTNFSIFGFPRIFLFHPPPPRCTVISTTERTRKCAYVNRAPRVGLRSLSLTRIDGESTKLAIK